MYGYEEYSGSYLPPNVDGKSHLRRDRLMGMLVRARNAGHRLFLIEGQAGQGKTTLTAQYVNEWSPGAFWYPMTTKDKDPAWLLRNLLGQLNQKLSFFSSPALDAMVEKGEIVSVDCHAYGQRLAESLESRPPLTLVFDDLHLLEAGSPSAVFLSGFLEAKAPEHTVFLLSRHPVSDLLFSGNQPLASTRLTGEALAMNRGEVADCLSTLFRLSPTREMVAQIHTTTEGWIMGVLARAHTLHASGEAPSFSEHPEAELKTYLDEELLRSFPPEVLPLLTDLSWCDTIPMELARTLTGQQDIDGLFAHLVRHNLFTRFTGETKTEAVFHHHLQVCLQEKSKTLRSEDELKKLFADMARWYETAGKPEDAARFFLDAGENNEVERLIRDRGLALCSAGRLETLRRSIGRMPEEAIRKRGWLACNYGIALMEVDPPQALTYLEAAERCFIRNEDPLGLLISRVQLLYFHTWVDARFTEGRPLLAPVHASLDAIESKLDEQVLLKTLYCLACGYAFFDVDLDSAARCADGALQLALKKGYDNAACEIRIIRCYIHGFKGDWKRFNTEMEPLVPLLASPRVSSYNKVIGWLTLLNILGMEGDFDNYRHYRELIFRIIGNEMLLNGVAQPFLHIWDMDEALAMGETATAKRIADSALALPFTGESPHMKSQFLHYQAFILAMSGKTASVPAISKESLELRLEAGSPYFIGLTRMITGGALMLAGQHQEAEARLTQAVEAFEIMGESFERSGALAHLSALLWKTGRTGEAKEWTGKWLRLMHRNRYIHYFTWTPSITGDLLDRAMAEGIETEAATRLARTCLKRGYTAKGAPLPLLAIRTFGVFSIFIENRNPLTLKDLTTSQQRLVALLLSRRDGTFSVDEIQALFWPDAPPQKGRASLDTMVSRFKKALKQIVVPHSPNEFLSVKKEKLILSNARVDAWQFMALAEEALQLFHTRAFWQAANRFRTAFSLVSGLYLTGFSDDGAGHEHREYVLRPLIQRASLAWFQSLVSLRVPMEKDLPIIESQVSGDPESLELVKALHRHHTATKAPQKAASLLRKYRDSLSREGLEDDEVESLLEDVWS